MTTLNFIIGMRVFEYSITITIVMLCYVMLYIGNYNILYIKCFVSNDYNGLLYMYKLMHKHY